MAYVLEALIVRGAPEWPEPVTRLGRLVPLRSPDGLPLGLVPLTEDVQSRLGVDSASARCWDSSSSGGPWQTSRRRRR